MDEQPKPFLASMVRAGSFDYLVEAMVRTGRLDAVVHEYTPETQAAIRDRVIALSGRVMGH